MPLLAKLPMADPMMLEGRPKQVPSEEEDDPAHIIKPCLERIQQSGVEEGRRNICGHALAVELRRLGNDPVAVRNQFDTWNQRNHPPMPLGEIETLVRSAFSRAYEYGCGELAILRRQPECVGPDNCPYYQAFRRKGKRHETQPE